MITPTQENLRFNGTLTNVIKVDNETVIVYDLLSPVDKKRWDYFGTLYGPLHPFTTPVEGKTTVVFQGVTLISPTGLPADNVAGFQIVEYTGITGASATGLAAGTIYTAVINIDGTDYNLSIDGANAASFTDLVNQVNTAIAPAGTCIITTTGNIKVTSASLGSSSSVLITDTDLFASTAGFVGINPPVPGSNLTSFDFTVTVNGIDTTVTVDGDVAQTYNDLAQVLSGLLAGTAVVNASDDGTDTTFEFLTPNAGSGESILVKEETSSLLSSLPATKRVNNTVRFGAINTLDAMKLTKIPEIQSYSFYDLYKYLFVALRTKPKDTAWFPNNSVVYWDGTTWRYVATDAPV